MTSSKTIGPQVHVRLTGAPSLESASSSKLQGLQLDRKGSRAVYRPLRRASESTFFKNLFAVSIASLAVVYLISRCSQHISFYPKERAATRLLAAGGSDGGFCPNWPGGGGREDQSGDEDEHQGYNPEGGQSSASTSIGGEAHGQGMSNPHGWGRRQIPFSWKGRFRHVLGMIEQLATTSLSLLPALSPEDAVLLGMRLSTLAAVELGTYAYISDDLQPSRAQAGAAFIDMLQALLEMEDTRNAARNMGVESRLYLLRHLHEELRATPPLTEKFTNYRLTMMSWWRTGLFTATQVAAPLSALHLEGNHDVVPSEKVRAFCKVLDAVFQTRKKQLLRSQTMRYWFVNRQRRVLSFFLYSKEEYDAARNKKALSSLSPSDEVYYAITAAGGTVVPVDLPESNSDHHQFLGEPAELSGFGSGPAHGPSAALHHRHSGLPSVPASVSPPPGFGPSPLPSYPSGPRQPVAQVLPQTPRSHPHGLLQVPRPPGRRHPTPAVQSPHPPPQSGALLHWETLGGRPRLRAEAGRRALQEGWGRRRMPPKWESKTKKDLEGMQTAAVVCSQVLPSLSPQQAVLLSKRLSMLAAVQLAALTYLPQILQPIREAVGDSYRHLLGQVLSAAPTLQAATAMNEVKALMSLQKLLEIIREPSPPTEVLSVSKYQTAMIVHHHTYSYANRQVLSLLKDLLLAQPSSGGASSQVKVLLKALQAMYPILKMQLLTDPAMRHPLVAAQRGSGECFLFTQQELSKAGQTRKPKLNEVIEALRQALVEAGGPSLDVGEAHTSEDSGPGQAHLSSHVAAQAITPPPPQPTLQQTRPVRPPSHVPPFPGFQPVPFQAPSAPAPTHALSFSTAAPPAHTSAVSGPGQAHPLDPSYASTGQSPQHMPQQSRFVRAPPHVAPPPVFQPMTFRAPTAPGHTQAFPFIPRPPPPLVQPLPRLSAPTPSRTTRHPRRASPWASSPSGSPQTLSGASSVQPHRGTAGSAGGQHHHGGSASAGGELGLVDLAARLSKLEIPDSEDEEDE
ncbi:hypothetical protein ACSSS7_003247 [Eimeria intestinalis]